MMNGIPSSLPRTELHSALAPRGVESMPQPPSSTESPPSFKDFMMQAIDQVNAMQQDADRSVEQLLTGGDANPAEVLTAVQKADMSFRMMLQVRNKLMEAFQEIKEIRI